MAVIKDLAKEVKKHQDKLINNAPETKEIKRKVLVYFIPFWWKQGRNSGFACYEQPMTEHVTHIGQLMHSAQNYAVQLHKAQMNQRKALPWWNIIEKLKISTKPFLIFPTDFRLLREAQEKMQIPAKPEEVN